MKKISEGACKISNGLTNGLNALVPLFALCIRVYLARIFLWSGLLKIMDWQTTLNLFQYEYKVPLLSPSVAAYIGTGSEIFFGALILIGLGARIPALGLILTNILMIVSYPILMTAEGSCMVKDHYFWLLLASIILFYGHGRWSVDALLQRKVCNNYKY